MSAETTVDVHSLLKDSIESVRIRKTSLNIDYQTRFTAKYSTVLLDNDGLRQVFLNCIFNGIDAIEEHSAISEGKIILETVNTVDDTISISISDNGIGLAKEHFDSIFDPFFTTKEVGKGTGLGLAVTHNMIKSAGGTLQFDAKEGKGATICITLPTTMELDKVHD